MLRCFSLVGALLMSYLPSLMACEGCKEPSNVAGDSGVVGIGASFSWSVVFMIGMLGFLLSGMVLMMVRSCRQLAAQHNVHRPSPSVLPSQPANFRAVAQSGVAGASVPEMF
jgi:hypothetical protein